MIKLNFLKSKNGVNSAKGVVHLVFSIALLAFAGCSDTPVDVKLSEQLYFDLKGYFDSEVQRLAKFQKVKKTATVDGQQEERTIDSLNFEEELKIFSNADINRAAWSDKYEIDSVFNQQQQLVQLNYTSKDEDLRTKKISIDFEANAVSKVFIENSTSSAVADTKQLLTYEPEVGYTIESHQKVSFTDDNTFLVEVRFLKN